MILKNLNSFSEEEIEAARRYSSVVEIYRQIILSSASGLEDKLRIERNHTWLQCGLSTFFKTHMPAQICAYWSERADDWLKIAFENCFHTDQTALFAMGKLGARELNLSSDVDLIIVRIDGSTVDAKSLKDFQNLIAARTEKGFVFRLDFNLRPGGQNSPLVPSFSEFESYYTSKGETWERLAQVRLRPLCGNRELIHQVADFSERFVYRKHLDYTLMEDLNRLRSSIRSEYQTPPSPSFHLKLQPGGIRDIELFVNALQVIHGGKDRDLRRNSTTEAIELLKDKNLLPPEDCDFLLKSYWEFRQLENLVQFESDRQTHILTATETEASHLNEQMQKMDKLVRTLLGPVQSPRIPQKLEDQFNWLKALGFSQEIIEHEWIPLWNLDVRSQNHQRDEEHRQMFLYTFIESLVKNGIDKEMGLRLLHEFVKSARAKASFFSTLNHTPKLLDDLVRLFSISPYIGGVICRKPELLDSYILRSVADESTDLEGLLDNLHDRKLLTEIFLIPQFLENPTQFSFAQDSLGQFLVGVSENADHIVSKLLEHLKKVFSISDASILALGKWGGQELGLRSDLDFVFVTEDEPQENHFKLARRLVNLLTQPGRGGPIYSIDLRLRPSGSSGPVLVSKKTLVKYLATEASPWELQAYTKARTIGSMDSLNWMPPPRKLSSEDLKLLEDIRNRALQAAGDFKYSEGGLLNIELNVQTAYLQNFGGYHPRLHAQILHLAKTNSAWKTLNDGYNVLRRYEQLLHICTDRSTSTWDPNHASSRLVARCVRKNVNEVSLEIEATLLANRKLLKGLDPYFIQK